MLFYLVSVWNILRGNSENCLHAGMLILRKLSYCCRQPLSHTGSIDSMVINTQVVIPIISLATAHKSYGKDGWQELFRGKWESAFRSGAERSVGLKLMLPTACITDPRSRMPLHPRRSCLDGDRLVDNLKQLNNYRFHHLDAHYFWFALN
jgi:hypothetical protein